MYSFFKIKRVFGERLYSGHAGHLSFFKRKNSVEIMILHLIVGNTISSVFIICSCNLKILFCNMYDRNRKTASETIGNGKSAKV